MEALNHTESSFSLYSTVGSKRQDSESFDSANIR